MIGLALTADSLIPAILTLSAALLAASLCSIFHQRISATSNNRLKSHNNAVNGLRGVLAIYVFLHHAAIWQVYVSTQTWQASTSYLQTHLGQSRVFILFMMTSFLFSTKLIKSKQNSLNWLHLYVSRIMRLTPLYLVMLGTVLFITAILSGFQLHEPLYVLLQNIGKWLSFTMLGQPGINRLDLVPIAGMVWTLPYEWFFYLIFPLFAVILRAPPAWPYILLGIISALGLYFWKPMPLLLVAYLGGTVVAYVVEYLVKTPNWRKIICSGYGGLGALLCVLMSATVTQNASHPVALLLLVTALIIVASGNTIFGFLTSKSVQVLGEKSYSIYLMHSVVLFIMFKFVIGFETASAMHEITFIGVTCLCISLIIPLSFLTYHYIEVPTLLLAPHITAKLEIFMPQSFSKLENSNN
jgi:peptidoglycan/LPS O-acetylase OafA/YrhL